MRACVLTVGDIAVRAAVSGCSHRGSLLTVPPVTINDDGTSTFTLVGTESDIQSAVDGVPDSVLGALSERQREAADAALSLGYYDVPREATIEEVATELDCATATAAEHLRKAESTVFSSLVR